MRTNRICNSFSFLFFSLLMLLALGSCEKEEFLLADETSDLSALNLIEQKEVSAFYEDVVLPTAVQEKIKEHILIQTQTAKSGEGDETFNELVNQLISRPTRRVDLAEFGEFGEKGEVFSYYVPTESPNEIVNVIIQFAADEVTNGYINVYQMLPDFASDFTNFNKGFEEFEGTLIIKPLSKLSDVWYQPENKNGNQDDCFTVAFEPSNDISGGGGGSGDVVGVSDPWSGLNWGRFNGTVYVFGGSGDSDSTPDPPVTTGCESGYRFTGRTTIKEGRSFHIYGFWDCDLGGFDPDRIEQHRRPPATFQGGGGLLFTNKENKSLDDEDCAQLLGAVGIVPRQLSTPSLDAKIQERIESAISQTCFNENAVMHIIEVPTFEACYDGGTVGSTCVTNQVIGYLNGLDFEPITFSDSPLAYTPSFSNISHDHLAIFLNAGVAADGNEHVLAGMSYARFKLNNPVISSNLAEQILYLSILHQEFDDPNEFVASAGDYLDIVENLNDDATNELLNSLVRNPTIISTVSDFFSEHNYDEISKNTVLLFANEIAGGIAYEEVGTDARNAIILENASSFENAISISGGAECCDDLFIPSEPNINAFTVLEFYFWHNDRFEEEVALLKYIYPEKYPLDTWRNRLKLKLDAEYRVMSGQLHLTADLLGLIPGVGVVPDLVNGVWYTLEGDGLNATMSYAAAIPAVGLLVGGKKLIKWIKFGASLRRLSWVRHSDGTIVFLPLKTKSWKQFWGFDGDVVGHHMIPKAQSGHPLLQKAANVTEEGATAFHPHDLANGYPLDPARHISNHTPYTNKIVAEMNRWHSAFGNATPEQASTAIKAWQDELRDLLTLTTGSIDDLNIPRIPDL